MLKNEAKHWVGMVCFGAIRGSPHRTLFETLQTHNDMRLVVSEPNNEFRRVLTTYTSDQNDTKMKQKYSQFLTIPK